LPPVTLKGNTRPLTVSNNKKISNDNFRVVTTHKKRMIQVNNLSKKYNGTTVLNIENLEIPKGSLGLVGNNGAGKTTFYFLDLIQPSTGSILNNGILVNASEDWKPLQLLLLTKAFDRLFDTGRVYFIGDLRVKTRLISMLY
jgi:ABC-type bacteriocin/lantibiotic exporter with double-glycine peptidase domain